MRGGHATPKSHPPAARRADYRSGACRRILISSFSSLLRPTAGGLSPVAQRLGFQPAAGHRVPIRPISGRTEKRLGLADTLCDGEFTPRTYLHNRED